MNINSDYGSLRLGLSVLQCFTYVFSKKYCIIYVLYKKELLEWYVTHDRH